MPACNPSYSSGRAGRLKVPVQPKQLSKTLSQKFKKSPVASCMRPGFTLQPVQHTPTGMHTGTHAPWEIPLRVPCGLWTPADKIYSKVPAVDPPLGNTPRLMLVYTRYMPWLCTETCITCVSGNRLSGPIPYLSDSCQMPRLYVGLSKLTFPTAASFTMTSLFPRQLFSAH